MAITRAQQFRQMLEDGGMLVKPGNGKRPGYRGSDFGGDQKKDTSGADYGSASKETRQAISREQDRGATPTRDDFKAQRKQATQALKKAGKKDQGIGDFLNNFALFKFGQALKDSEFNKRRKKKFMRDLTALSKRLQIPRNINLPFNIGSFDANARVNNNLVSRLLDQYQKEFNINPLVPGPQKEFQDIKRISLDDLSKTQQEEIYDRVMDARMKGLTDASGNLKAGFMFDAQGNIISTGNDGRDLEAEQRALIAQAVNPNQATTPTEETTTDPGFYRLLADGGRAGFREAGIAGREYDQADTATKEAISREQDRGATPTSEEFRDQARDIRRREIPKGVKRAASAISLFTPIGQIEEARKFKKFLQLKKAIDLGKNIKDVYDEDEDLGPLIGPPGIDIQNIRQNPYGDLPGSDLRVDALTLPTEGAMGLNLKTLRDFKQEGFTDDQIQEAIDDGYIDDLYKSITGPVPAAEGGRIGAMEGGIMDLETGRQMYFLGKLVKKATRAVKKIAKSPIGKAAIGAALFKAGGGFKGLGSLFGTGSLNPLKAEIMDSGTRGIGLSKFGRILSGFGLVDPSTQKLTGLAKILGAGALTLSPLLFGKQEDDDDTIDPALLGPKIDIARLLARPYEATLGQGFVRSAADGGRIGYQEGSKEPVAKKTMPLLDMGGQEMDLRDNGGFVPIGRMEKADDVPARLSKNEFVFTADAVRNAGDGDIDKGAEVMYNMMKNLEDGGNVSEESQGLEGARNMFQTAQRLEEVL